MARSRDDAHPEPEPRAFVRTLVAFRSGDEFGVGEAHDVSATGIFVRSDHVLPVGAVVDLKIRVESGETQEVVQVHGEVVRSSSGAPVEPEGKGFAVRFERGSPSAGRFREIVSASTVRTHFGSGDGQRYVEGGKAARRYDIVRLIGSGATCDVFKAHDHELDHTVAIKVLKAHFATDAELVERLHREEELVRRIGSDCVARVHGNGIIDGLPFIHMEYVEGQSLARLLFERGQLSEDELVTIALDVTEGLAAAHRVGVVHRDLKPANLIVTPDGHAKVLDFGIARARVQSHLTQVGSFIGTPTYAAPEQLVGATASPRTDVYAMGCVLYRALTGRDLQDASDMASIIDQALRTRRCTVKELRRDVTHTLDGIVTRCLARDPADRFGDGQALHDALLRLRAAPSPQPRVARRRRALLGEPDETAARRIESILVEQGFEVRRIDDGFQLVEIALAVPPDLVVLSATLPSVDGFEAIEILRSSPGTRHVPLVLTSTSESDGRTVSFLETAKFARKPIVSQELVLALNDACSPSAACVT